MKCAGSAALNWVRRLSCVVFLCADLFPAPTLAQPANMTERLKVLMDSPDHPLPFLPVVVPELTTRAQIDEIVNLSREPFIFMLYRAGGPLGAAQVPELYFFQLMAIEYLGDPQNPAVHFRTIAVDKTPEAASELFATDATQPVYVLFDPRKSGDERFRVIDQAKAPAGSNFDQRVVEAWIATNLGVRPAVLTPFQITTENQHDVIFVQPSKNPSPTAQWIVILYSPPDPEQRATVNRLKTLMVVEGTFYGGRLRFGEVDLGSNAGVFQTLIGDKNQLSVPAEPQIWLTDPIARISVQYTPQNGRSPIADLNQQSFEAWLAENHVLPPGSVALNAEMVSQAVRSGAAHPAN